MVLNPLMLWGAGLGITVYVALVDIEKVARHRGAVTVDFDEGGERRLTEAEFKRHKRTNAQMMIALAAVFWVLIAKYSQKE